MDDCVMKIKVKSPGGYGVLVYISVLTFEYPDRLFDLYSRPILCNEY